MFYKCVFLTAFKYENCPQGTFGPSMQLFMLSDKCITKTSPCNEDPLTPHFYIVKLGFTGAFISSPEPKAHKVSL